MSSWGNSYVSDKPPTKQEIDRQLYCQCERPNIAANPQAAERVERDPVCIKCGRRPKPKEKRS